MGICADWSGRRRSFVSGGASDTLDLVLGYGGNAVLGIDEEWNRLAETLSYAVSSEARFAPVLMGKYWSVIMGYFLLKWSTIVADDVTSSRKI